MSKQPMRGQDTGQMLAQTDLQELLCWNCGNSRQHQMKQKSKMAIGLISALCREFQSRYLAKKGWGETVSEQELKQLKCTKTLGN